MPSFLSREAQDLIARLIQRDTTKRPSAARLLRHPFFSRPGRPLTNIYSSNHVSGISHATTLKSQTVLGKAASLMESKNNVHSSSDFPEFDTRRLKPLKQQTKHGLVEILSDGSILLSLEGDKSRIQIDNASKRVSAPCCVEFNLIN